MELTPTQVELITKKLAAGATPEAIANSIGRMNDLEPDAIAELRDAAHQLARELATD